MLSMHIRRGPERERAGGATEKKWSGLKAVQVHLSASEGQGGGNREEMVWPQG